MAAMLPPIVPPSRRPADLIFRVQPALSRYERSQFVGVARRLYRGDRRWLPPLASPRRDALRPARNPLLRGGDLGAFLGVAQNLGLGDETVGALAAWYRPRAAENEEDALGAWGFFDAMNVEGLVDKLFYEAESWLFEHTPGMIGIRGPVSIEPLTCPGLLTDGFDAQPAAFLPYNLPYYPEIVEGQGYEPARMWRAYTLSLSSPPRLSSRTRAGPAVTGDLWRGISRAYRSADIGEAGAADLVPGLLQWLDHLSGVAAFMFNDAWEWVADRAFRNAIVATGEDGTGRAACLGVPDLAGALRASRGHRFPFGWLFFEIAMRRSPRLRVFPAVAPDAWPANRLAGLYRELGGSALGVGYREMVVAPVPDDDWRSVEALTAVGARPTQAFTIYEKRF